MINKLSIILIAIIVTLLGVLIYTFANQPKNPSIDAIHADSTENQKVNYDQYSETENQVKIVRPEPNGGRLKAIVELGTDGFNYFIVKIDGKKDWELVKPVYGASLSKENLLTESGLLQGLRNFIREIINYGVEGVNIHFAVSSGAQKNPEVIRMTNGLKELGYVVNTVNYKKEAEGAWLAAVPKHLREESFVIDLGSGNTKVAWIGHDGKLVTQETYGAKYYQDEIGDQRVINNVKSIAELVPIGRTKYCFIIGGVPYQMSKASQIGDERFTYLNEASHYNLEGKKNKSGLLIYKTFRQTTRCDQFIFDSHANFTIGYLLSIS
ncbi:MAG: hypothetical protein AAFX87_18685 [Bacteroidota bacterium]